MSRPGSVVITRVLIGVAAVVGGGLALLVLLPFGVHQRSALIGVAIVLGVATVAVAVTWFLPASSHRPPPVDDRVVRPPSDRWFADQASAPDRSGRDPGFGPPPAPRPDRVQRSARAAETETGRPRPPAPATLTRVPIAAAAPDRPAASPGAGRIVQCPNCGDFAVDLSRDATRFAFGCTGCGHRWHWTAGTPWPVTVVRPRARLRAGAPRS